MMMLCHDAYVSGSLGCAVFRRQVHSDWHFLESPTANPRYCLHNELFFFREVAVACAPADPELHPVPIEVVRRRLEEEINHFTGLDGLLVGMDPKVPEKLRRRSMARAEVVLESSELFRSRIQRQFLIPANLQDWDYPGHSD
jgi:hypothetical protein